MPEPASQDAIRDSLVRALDRQIKDHVDAVNRHNPEHGLLLSQVIRNLAAARSNLLRGKKDEQP